MKQARSLAVTAAAQEAHSLATWRDAVTNIQHYPPKGASCRQETAFPGTELLLPLNPAHLTFFNLSYSPCKVRDFIPISQMGKLRLRIVQDHTADNKQGQNLDQSVYDLPNHAVSSISDN